MKSARRCCLGLMLMWDLGAAQNVLVQVDSEVINERLANNLIDDIEDVYCTLPDLSTVRLTILLL